MTTLADLTTAALKLSDADRATLADALLESLPPDDDESCTDDLGYDAEIKRRVEAVQNGTADLVPWEQVRRELMADDPDAAG